MNADPSKTITPHDTGCIFCKIVAGQIPCHKLYEDERVLSFLDIGPLSRGHCLVIPKAHYETIDATPGDLAGACAAVIARVSGAVRAATGATGFNVLQNNGAVSGQEVAHMHFHIIPRQANDGLGYRWLPGKLDAAGAATLIKAIGAGLER